MQRTADGGTQPHQYLCNTVPVPKAQGKSQKRDKDCESQRNRKSAVIPYLLERTGKLQQVVLSSQEWHSLHWSPGTGFSALSDHRIFQCQYTEDKRFWHMKLWEIHSDLSNDSSSGYVLFDFNKLPVFHRLPVSNFIPVWLEKTVCIALIFKILLRFVLWPNR